MKKKSVNRHIGICVAMGLMAMGPSSQAQHEDGAATAEPPDGFHLGTRGNGETGKASFLLNGQPFYPFVYFEHYRAVTPKLLTQLRSEGFNSIQIAIDASDAGSEDLKQVLQLLNRQGIPTFVEINEWEFLNVLRADLSLNMVTVDGKPVKHFPDYANPETRRQHLERFARAAKFLKPYAHQPVIGICVGAYDAYHLPDGEKHPDFEAPKLVQKYQTFLPFGEHARIRFIQRLKETGVSPQSLGLERLESMARPPSTPEEASSPLLWREWIHFRRHLVREWLKETLEVVKAGAGLPVTVTFDINFSLREQYATPPAGWVDLLDFVILYYYGQGDPAVFIPSLLREVYRGFNDAGKPMICLHEFGSAYGITSGEAYARNSAPFVSGMMTTGPRWTSLVPDARPHNQERVQSFTRWVREHLVGLADSAPPRSPLLILLDQDLAYAENPFSATLAPLGIDYDVMYVTAKMARIPPNGYSHILIPATFAPDLKRKIPSGVKVIVTNSGWLQELPSPAIPKGTPDQWQRTKTLLADDFTSMEPGNWTVTLPGNSWKIAEGWLEIRKSPEAAGDFVSNPAFGPPCLIEFEAQSLEDNPWMLSLSDAADASNAVKPTTGQAGSLKLSLGINKGAFEVVSETWHGFFDDVLMESGIRVDLPVTVSCYILPHNEQMNTLHLMLKQKQGAAESTEAAACTVLIPARRSDRLRLVAAQKETAARINWVRIAELKKKTEWRAGAGPEGKTCER